MMNILQTDVLLPLTGGGKRWRKILGLLLISLCAGCSTIGPDYQRPTVNHLPANWKKLPATDAAQWQVAQPADAQPKQDWWKVFGDEELDRLMARCISANFSLQVALSRLDQALAQLALHSAEQAPVVQANVNASRTRTSSNRPLANYDVSNSTTIQNDFRPTLSVSYEFDWLGRIRRDIESAQASAEQSAADAENVRLLLTAQLASSYFQLRQLDEELHVVQENLDLENKVLNLQLKRYQAGAGTLTDLAQQRALVQTTQTQLELLQAQRAQQENALATLTATPAAEFHLASARLPNTMPVVPVSLPSTLLERRPDVASAEHAIAAANAQIGVAQAGYYPNLLLTPGYGGFESNNLSRLISVPSLIWSLGISSTLTLFDGGHTNATVENAKAFYTGTVATYRQTVLTAIEETQNALGNLQEATLAKQHQDQAVQEENQALRVGLARYREGLDNPLQLALTQQNLLTAQRTQSQLKGSQFQYTVALIKALGGSWNGVTDAHAVEQSLTAP